MRKLLLLLFLIMIATFSSSPSLLVKDPSTWVEKPRYVSEFDVRFIVALDSEFYQPYGLFRDSSEFILRKIGHFIAYASLALLFFVNLWRLRLRYRLFFSWLLASLVGFADEINQHFIIGRDGRLMDVILNSSAAFTAVVVAAVFLLVKRSLENHKVKFDRRLSG